MSDFDRFSRLPGIFEENFRTFVICPLQNPRTTEHFSPALTYRPKCTPFCNCTKSHSKATEANFHHTIQRQCRTDRDNYIDKICSEIQKCSNTAHTRDMYQKVKLLAQEFKPRHWTIESITGTITLLDKKAILDRWRQYCQQLYSDKYASDDVYNRLDCTDKDSSS